MSWLGPAISAVGSLVGGFLDRSESQQQASAQHERDSALQRQFAQEGIRWRVEDAKAAGLHPLFALGAQIPTYSPSVFMGGGGSMGASLASGGQDIGRAIDATRTSEERVTARLEALQIERGELENEMLRSKIARLNATPNPPMPSAALGMEQPASDTGIGSGISWPAAIVIAPSPSHIAERPMERTVTVPSRPWSEVGGVPDAGYLQTPSGLAPAPSKDAKERIEDMFIQEMLWSYRNNLLPMFDSQSRTAPPWDQLPPGATGWEYTGLEWEPVYGRKPRTMWQKLGDWARDRWDRHTRFSFERR